MKSTRKIKIILVGLAVIIFIIVYSGWSIFSYSNKSELIKADAAIVLGAAVWGDKPSPVFAERINYAIWLYKNDYVDKIIFTGGKGDNNELADSVVAKQYAIVNSIPNKDILVETESKITEQNLYYAKQIAEENNFKTFLIVSDPLHMKRAMLMAKDLNLDSYSSPTLTSRYQGWRSKLSFLSREVYFYIGYIISRPFSRN